MVFIMNKKIQLFFSFIIILSCIGAIVYSINFSREEDARKSFKEVNSIIQEYKNMGNTEVYDGFLKNFNCQGEKYYYSFLELVGYDYPILLLSNGVYKFNNESEVALWIDIYYPVNNEITNFGNISSNGTAYPISANTTGIYTAGGHEVTKYRLDIQNRKLKLMSKEEVELKRMMVEGILSLQAGDSPVAIEAKLMVFLPASSRKSMKDSSEGG